MSPLIILPSDTGIEWATIRSVNDGVYDSTIPNRMDSVRSNSPGNNYDVISVSADPFPAEKFVFQIEPTAWDSSTSFNSQPFLVTTCRWGVDAEVPTSQTEQSLAAETFGFYQGGVDYSWDGTNFLARTTVAPFDSSLPEIITVVVDAPAKKIWLYWERVGVWYQGIPYTNPAAPFTFTSSPSHYLTVYSWDNGTDDNAYYFDPALMTLGAGIKSALEGAGYRIGWRK